MISIKGYKALLSGQLCPEQKYPEQSRLERIVAKENLPEISYKD